MIDDMYRGRPLSRGYPKLEELSVEWFKVHQSQETPTEETTRCLENLIDLSSGPRTVAVVGCGPNPYSVEALLDLGYDAVGIEPVPGYAEVARAYLGDPQRILVGSAERLPLRDQSQKVVLLQSVLEHVDSPIKSLEEAHRVTSPGGVTFVSTTNRHRFSVTGHNDEFRVRFYNWLPQIAKECYVFKHLHFDPTLANYTPRPAVHWFSFTDLCELGRQAGFAQFYSRFDLVDYDAASIRKSVWRRWFVRAFRRSLLVRAMGLVFFGEQIFMWKRSCEADTGAAMPR